MIKGRDPSAEASREAVVVEHVHEVVPPNGIEGLLDVQVEL